MKENIFGEGNKSSKFVSMPPSSLAENGPVSCSSVPMRISDTRRFSVKSSDRFDAIVTLGCVVKGETAHFDLSAA